MPSSTTSPGPYILEPGWPAAQPVDETALIQAVNAHRKTLGLSQLQPYAGLTANAEWKASNQAQYGYEDHNQPAGTVPGNPAATTVYDRFTAYGFGANAWGENIAYGFTDIPTVMAAWLSDYGHKQNLENPSWTHIGCGVATSTPTTAADGTPVRALTWWVQDFAALQATPPPVVPPGLPAPALHSQWRPKLNPFAKPITVLGIDAQGRVQAQNRKGQPLKPITLTAWYTKYRLVQ